MKAGEACYDMSNGDTIVVPADAMAMYMRCCSCGIWHELEFEIQDNGDLHIKIERIEEPEIDSDHPGSTFILANGDILKNRAFP